MNAWPADALNLPNHDNGAFHQATIDPSQAFLQASPTPDPTQYQRMFNGVPRNVSPGFHNPNQVIPSKRPRPEDGLSMSPRQAPGGIAASRSQTPHQVPFPGYQGAANGAPQFPSHPTPYQHLQQGASPNVTQSPIMQDFDQHGIQRMGTASPSPFTPAGPQVGTHMSPTQSDHPSRVNTPQNNTFMPGQPFPPGMGPQFAPAPAMTTAGVQPPMQAHFGGMPQGYQQAIAAQQQQRLHAMQMQQQGRPMVMNPAIAGRPMAAGMNAMANPQQMAAIRQMQQTMAKPMNPEGFMRSLQKFMMSRNLVLDPNPHVCGRPINLVQLYATVMKLGGSKKITATNMWQVIATQLQFPPMQVPMAAQEIREHYQRNLAAYEQAFLSNQQKQYAEQMQQSSLSRQPSDPSGMQLQSPAGKPVQGFETPQQIGHPSPSSAPGPNNVQHNAANGFATPTPVPEFGSLDYELDRAVDRLICITTILRNFSFSDSNFAILSTPPVVQFMSTIIRYLGTRNMLLRTHQNTLDFMKDTVTYLSNVAHTIQLPSKEEALCLLHFLLSFAPFPGPVIGSEGIMFTSYNPSVHKYTPAAVDSLAKLLARDEPNRTFFRAIFSGEGGSNQQELLTRAFGLAICPIPDQPRKPLAIADLRKVFLMQGLLAADILSGYADGPTAKTWLESVDGFAIHLLRLSCLLSTERVPPPPPTNARQSHAARGQADEAEAYRSIINRGLAILRRLAEKSKLADTNSTVHFPSGIVPRKESLLGALLMPNIDPGVVRQLLTYARLAE
ncbi:hypothetical protein BO99DRAFT_196920 [Aspergillus violaceofuscus CBS 115571]|uniref:ARID domain-containing protein n=1 Tax=Aspergillus violaceofuscus (strain CBS 115571) TaxID=1450538 RepID=A0A2V5H0F9_ASPV1|nr:hypothetical protein BO99DRAFT_196920 [Aspergillus violaceofuscus CBS 115571]